MPNNPRLVDKYLNSNSIVRSHKLESAFLGCNDKEDAWKLGLVHFVDGVLYSQDANAKVDMYLFSLVEREEDFFNYPFGTESFKRTLIGLDKDMVHLRSLYLKSLEKRNAKKDGATKYTAKAKYIVYGYTIALQYCAYDAIAQLDMKYATLVDVKSLRMLSWKSTQMIYKDDLITDLKWKKVEYFDHSSVYLSILYFLRKFFILFN